MFDAVVDADGETDGDAVALCECVGSDVALAVAQPLGVRDVTPDVVGAPRADAGAPCVGDTLGDRDADAEPVDEPVPVIVTRTVREPLTLRDTAAVTDGEADEVAAADGDSELLVDMESDVECVVDRVAVDDRVRLGDADAVTLRVAAVERVDVTELEIETVPVAFAVARLLLEKLALPETNADAEAEPDCEGDAENDALAETEGVALAVTVLVDVRDAGFVCDESSVAVPETEGDGETVVDCDADPVGDAENHATQSHTPTTRLLPESATARKRALPLAAKETAAGALKDAASADEADVAFPRTPLPARVDAMPENDADGAIEE